VRELSALYGARIAGRPSPLPPLSLQYADFAAWQRAWLQGEVLERQLAYWRERLAGIAVLGLATDRPRPILPAAPSGQRLAVVPPALNAAAARVQPERGATPFMTLLAPSRRSCTAIRGRTTSPSAPPSPTVIAARWRA